jgi:hypothetical protein
VRRGVKPIIGAEHEAAAAGGGGGGGWVGHGSRATRLRMMGLGFPRVVGLKRRGGDRFFFPEREMAIELGPGFPKPPGQGYHAPTVNTVIAR